MKIFHDLGHHDGAGLRAFSESWGMDKSWRLYCWEPNPESFLKWMVPAPNRVNLPCAAWWHDGALWLSQEETEWGTADGWASSVMPGWKGFPLAASGARVNGTGVRVPCLDFASFLVSNSLRGDKIHIKMDIEGAEFDVLGRMLEVLEPEHWGRIESLAVEWHERFLPVDRIGIPEYAAMREEQADRLDKLTHLYEWH